MELSSSPSQCTICNLPSHIFTITKCGHNNICFLCTLKLRSLKFNFKCPLCNTILPNVVFTKNQNSTFADFNLDNIIPYQDGIYFDDISTMEEVVKFNQLTCPISTCQNTTVYESMEKLKKHIKDEHNRMFCDLCLKNRTLLFKEQKLYTSTQLEKHLKKGDIDDEGNIVFFHPFCKFCYEYLYDEEELQKHLTQNHFICHLCGDDTKYIWYKKYENIEIHFKFSHYLCPDPECKANCFVVFKTSAELENHNLKMHLKDQNAVKNLSSSILLSMTGFNYGESDYKKKKKEVKSTIKDREGWDFENQFLSKRSLKIIEYTDKQVSPDEQIDLRDYYEKYGIKDFDLINQMESSVQYPISTTNNEQYHGRYQGRKWEKKYYSRGQIIQDSRSEEQQQILYMEDTNMIKYQIVLITWEEFEKNMTNILSEHNWRNLGYSITDYFQRRIDEYRLFDSFVQALGQKCAYQVFPFLIATAENETIAKELDKFFYNLIIKLPKKIASPVSSIKTYGELFNLIEDELETNITLRINQNKFNIKGNSYIMDPARIFQLNKIVLRLTNHDMSRFKFSKQFGISDETHQLMINLMIADKNSTQEKLFSIPENELLILYVYIQMCQDHLHTKNSYPDINKVSRNLLAKIFSKYPNIKDLFEKTLGKKEFAKLVEKDIDLNKTNGFRIQSPTKTQGDNGHLIQGDIEEAKDSNLIHLHSFDPKNKFEFPVLPEQPLEPITNISNQKESKKTLNKIKPKKNVKKEKTSKPMAQKKNHVREESPEDYPVLKERIPEEPPILKEKPQPVPNVKKNIQDFPSLLSQEPRDTPISKEKPKEVFKPKGKPQKAPDVKEIPQDFPSLMKGPQESDKPIWEQENEWSKLASKVIGSQDDEEEEGDEWNMVNGKKSGNKLKKMVVNEKKNKKGEKILFLSGGFK